MGVYSRKLSRGIRWYFRGQYLGTPYLSKAIYLSKRECLDAERIKLDELDRKLRSGNTDLTLFDLFNNRLDVVKNNKSLKYYEENRRFFKMFLKFSTRKNILMASQVRKADVYKFLIDFSADLKNDGKGNWKANACIRILKAAFNEAIDVYDVDMKNPLKGIKMFSINIKTKYIPSDEDIEAVCKMCTPEQQRLINFVAETGCRIMEAIRLDYLDVDVKKVTLYTRKSKNSNFTPRFVVKPDWLSHGKGKVFEWNSYPRFLETKVTQLKQRKWSWHNLRHRRASLWASQGMTLIEIMYRLGHSNAQTTQRYLQFLGFTGGENLAKENIEKW